MDRQIIQHYRSDIPNSIPQISEIEYGEIAINYAASGESIYIKNSSDQLVEFVPKSYIDKRVIGPQLKLRAYLFDFSGTYTKANLESKLSVPLSDIIATLYEGGSLVIFSRDEISSNVSSVIESNYTLTEDGELKSLTLVWHQYQLWNELYVVLNNDGTYTVTITHT